MSKYLAHMDVELPAWVGQWMEPLRWGLGGALALWILVAVYRWSVARAYNLTKAERASVNKNNRPDFLTVDQEAQDAAIARGEAYVRPADRDPVPPSAAEPDPGIWVRIGAVARLGAVIAALLNIVVGVAAAVILQEDAKDPASTLASAHYWEIVLSRYWIGLALAVLLVVIEFARWIIGRRRVAAGPVT